MSFCGRNAADDCVRAQSDLIHDDATGRSRIRSAPCEV